MATRTETVELRLRSALPSSEDLKGLTTVLAKLTEIQTLIANINKTAVAPSGLSQIEKDLHQITKANSDLASAQNKNADATIRDNAAMKEQVRILDQLSVAGRNLDKVIFKKNYDSKAEQRIEQKSPIPGVKVTESFPSLSGTAPNATSIEVNRQKWLSDLQKRIDATHRLATEGANAEEKRQAQLTNMQLKAQKAAAEERSQQEDDSWKANRTQQAAKKAADLSAMEAQAQERAAAIKNANKMVMAAEIKAFEESESERQKGVKAKQEREKRDQQEAHKLAVQGAGDEQKRMRDLGKMDRDAQADGEKQAEERADKAYKERRKRQDGRKKDEMNAMWQQQEAQAAALEDSIKRQTQQEIAAFELSKRVPRQQPAAEVPSGLPLPRGTELPSSAASGIGLMAPENMLKNFFKVSSWLIPAQIALGSINAVEEAMQRFVAIDSQVQRLSQVFKSNSETLIEHNAAVRGLADSLLGLAAANGRSSDEAMEAGIAWSRLGLSQKQVAEASRVSMVGANVAELTSAQTTKYLISLMSAYGFKVGELNGVLGVLNNTSNVYNVTNKDLLEGLSRCVAIASQAGMSFLELQGIIGATAGKTANTGTQIGNAMKTIMVRMATPEMQDLLKNRANVDTTRMGPGGVEEMRDFSDILRDLWVQWQKMTNEQRNFITQQAGGATQANRFVAIMNSYLQGQRLAIEGALNLNSAEQENLKILNSQRAQWMGIRSEMDRSFNRAMNAPQAILGGTSINQGMVGGLKTVHNVLRAVNELNLGGTITGAIGGAMLGGVPGAVVGGGAGALNTLLGQKMEGSKWSALFGGAGGAIGGGILGAKLGLMTGGHPLAVLGGTLVGAGVGGWMGSGKFNEWVERNIPATIQDRLLEAEAKVQGASMEAQGHTLRGKYYESIGRAMAINPEMASEYAKGLESPSMAGPQQARKIRDLIGSGDIAGAQGLLKQMGTAELKAASSDFVREKILTTQSVAEIDQEIADLEKQGAKKKDILALEKARNELLERNKALVEEEGEILNKNVGHLSRMKTLEAGRLVRQQIGEYFGMMPTSGAGSKLALDVATLRSQADFLDKFYNQIVADPRFQGPSGQSQALQVKQEWYQTQAALYARQTPLAMQTANQMDINDWNQRMARIQIGGFARGRDDAERLINQLTATVNLADRKYEEAKKTGKNEDILTALEAEKAYREQLIQKAELQTKLETDRYNIMQEQKRLYEESLLMAGPADLVRKLIVKRAADQAGPGGLGLGDFLSMGERAKQDYADLTGLFQVRRIDAQINALNEDTKNNPVDVNREFPWQNARMGELYGMLKVPALPKDAIANHEINNNLTMLSSRVIEVTQSLEAFRNVLDSISGFTGNIKGTEMISEPAHWDPISFSRQGGVMA